MKSMIIVFVLGCFMVGFVVIGFLGVFVVVSRLVKVIVFNVELSLRRNWCC